MDPSVWGGNAPVTHVLITVDGEFFSLHNAPLPGVKHKHFLIPT